MYLKRLLIGIAFTVFGSANASTVLMPTDGDVNFLFSPLPSGVSLYMFDDDDNNLFASATSNLLVPVPSIVGISGPQSGDYLASNVNGSLTLSDSHNFVMAVWDANLNSGAGAWVGDANPVWYGNGNSVQLTFATSGGVLAVDVQPVPVPAALWLFGSGLIGLVGLARRKA
jgi:hypothetical protein